MDETPAPADPGQPGTHDARSDGDGLRAEIGQPAASAGPRDTYVLVGDGGRVAVRWGTRDQWYVLSPGSAPDALGPQTREQLGGLGWTERPHSPRLGPHSLDLVARCRMAIEQFDGHPSGAWSTGEQLFVALVLKDTQTLDELDYTSQQAAQRLIGEGWAPTDPAEFTRWLTALRVEVAFPGFLTGPSEPG
ncbi:hypothetical protein [Amycolatopsis sp. cmx-4-61]|uniref:hypothetical protein n=1 Tax=Amycolatopsis sp. cmx-4-61 TaxID=2790937 RepID=UPI00397C5D11